jgi:hypothetical protein
MFEYPMHIFDVAPALETVNSPNGARFMMRSVLVSPVPTSQSLLVNLTYVVVGQSDGPRGPTDRKCHR